MHHSTPAHTRPSNSRSHTGFTLVELLVVIGIIALLIGLLLPALGKVMERARVTTTQGTMQEFSKACDAYFQEFGEYPGVVPEDALEAGLSGTDASAPPISGTENALLALMGGYRVPTDTDYGTYGGTILTFNNVPPFTIKINPSKIGEGPTRNGKKFDSFFSPKGREFGAAKGQMIGSSLEDPAAAFRLPDLLDAWGTPIIYVRQSRTLGPLVSTKTSPGGVVGQWSRAGILSYTLSTELGDLTNDQTNLSSYSLFNTQSAGGAAGTRARDLTFGQMIRHPAQTITAATDQARVDAGTARGKYILISAGPDGLYFSSAQGLGTPTAPKGDIVSSVQNPDGPRIIDRYDDLLIAGGS